MEVVKKTIIKRRDLLRSFRRVKGQRDTVVLDLLVKPKTAFNAKEHTKQKKILHPLNRTNHCLILRALVVATTTRVFILKARILLKRGAF